MRKQLCCPLGFLNCCICHAPQQTMQSMAGDVIDCGQLYRIIAPPCRRFARASAQGRNSPQVFSGSCESIIIACARHRVWLATVRSIGCVDRSDGWNFIPPLSHLSSRRPICRSKRRESAYNIVYSVFKVQ